ncbi:BZIP family transcription factor family protein [Rhynchospora pubera]|uniref:BZIP family transcription factor family protein n=1 Tax=Rhynchospora pubera TaxID=906938 RepID=A0AAV8HPB4_9POAL|nr:BZIP family transcription factor family protein [Rhynchospora pubera]
MESYGVGKTGPSRQPLGYAPTTPASHFFDHEGATYFGELEEALMQDISGTSAGSNRKPFITTNRPPTLEIFPSWPMRYNQTPKESVDREESSTDSGSGQNTASQVESESPVSRKTGGGLSEQEEMMAIRATVNGDAGQGGANYPTKNQEKKIITGSTAEKSVKMLDAKTLRRLAQNREAARKSRLRKKAYIQQLESSKVKLAQMEQDLNRARSQGLFLGGATGGNLSPGTAMFDMEYARWLDENQRHMNDLRGGLAAHLSDADLRVIVDEYLTHHDDLFQLKAVTAKTDVFHLITGLWATPAERCFLWIGGFRPSELIKILLPQLDPLTEQQVVGICNLQQSSQQAEEALSQGLEQLHQSLANTMASGSLCEATDMGSYMGQMATALGTLSNLERFVRQADNLRQQTLHQLHRILTVRQSARCFSAIGEYHSRLRALSSLWASRPKETMVGDHESNCNELQAIHQPAASQFQAF